MLFLLFLWHLGASMLGSTVTDNIQLRQLLASSSQQVEAYCACLRSLSKYYGTLGPGVRFQHAFLFKKKSTHSLLLFFTLCFSVYLILSYPCEFRGRVPRGKPTATESRYQVIPITVAEIPAEVLPRNWGCVFSSSAAVGFCSTRAHTCSWWDLTSSQRLGTEPTTVRLSRRLDKMR